MDNLVNQLSVVSLRKVVNTREDGVINGVQDDLLSNGAHLSLYHNVLLSKGAYIFSVPFLETCWRSHIK